MEPYSPAWPHGKIPEIFPHIYFVMGTNFTTHEGTVLQHSCNMVVVKNGDELTLINTLRLTDAGLAKLDTLGKVTHVVRIGAFHGRHDAFYIDRYQAKLWALQGMQHEHHKQTDIVLKPNGQMPFPDCSLFVFATSVYPEGVLHINREGGVLITCDSVKNWTYVDPYFSEETGKLYEQLGFIGKATVSKIWLDATQVKNEDFERLNKLAFKHLISAHGEPLMNVCMG